MATITTITIADTVAAVDTVVVVIAVVSNFRNQRLIH